MQQIALEEIVKIQQKGLITIPKKIREELGLVENGFVRLKKEKGKLVMEPVRTLSYPVRSYTEKEIEEFLKLDEEETKALKKKKLL